MQQAKKITEKVMTLNSNLPHLKNSKFKKDMNKESKYLKMASPVKKKKNKVTSKTEQKKPEKGFQNVEELEESPIASIEPEGAAVNNMINHSARDKQKLSRFESESDSKKRQEIE